MNYRKVIERIGISTRKPRQRIAYFISPNSRNALITLGEMLREEIGERLRQEAENDSLRKEIHHLKVKLNELAADYKYEEGF